MDFCNGLSKGKQHELYILMLTVSFSNSTVSVQMLYSHPFYKILINKRSRNIFKLGKWHLILLPNIYIFPEYGWVVVMNIVQTDITFLLAPSHIVSFSDK